MRTRMGVYCYYRVLSLGDRPSIKSYTGKDHENHDSKWRTGLLNYWRSVHMIMFLRVGMKVLMEKFAVTVHVPVDEVGRHQ